MRASFEQKAGVHHTVRGGTEGLRQTQRADGVGAGKVEVEATGAGCEGHLVEEGDVVLCPHCRRTHELERDRNVPTSMYLWYRCDGRAYLGAVNGRLVS